MLFNDLMLGKTEYNFNSNKYFMLFVEDDNYKYANLEFNNELLREEGADEVIEPPAIDFMPVNKSEDFESAIFPPKKLGLHKMLEGEDFYFCLTTMPSFSMSFDRNSPYSLFYSYGYTFGFFGVEMDYSVIERFHRGEDKTSFVPRIRISSFQHRHPRSNEKGFFWDGEKSFDLSGKLIGETSGYEINLLKNGVEKFEELFRFLKSNKNGLLVKRIEKYTSSEETLERISSHRKVLNKEYLNYKESRLA